MNDAQKERLRKYHETSKKKEHDDEVDINKIMQEVKLESEGIKIYDNPAIWTKEDIESHLDGGAFFYRSLSDSDELALLAKISYREGWTEKDYRRLLSKKADIGEIFPFKVMVCEPFEVPRGPIILRSIASWLRANSFNTFCDAITSRVMGQEDTKRVVANVYNYLQCLVSGKQHNNNILLAAPSGCGKTETYRAIRDYFKEKIPRLPVYQIDMTSVTEEGFKGNNTEYMVKELVTNFETQGIGIVFLDEFDKKLLPSYSSKGSNVNAAVQSQILTIIEGRIFEAGAVKINTANTMFIALGAFDSCRVKRTEERHIGFGAKETVKQKHYSSVSREEMIGIGASYELIGRFSSILNYHELGEEAIDEVINSMIDKESDALGCRIVIDNKMREFLHKSANGKFGCRLLRSAIHDRAMKVYVDMLEADQTSSLCTIYMEGEDMVRFSAEGKAG